MRVIKITLMLSFFLLSVNASEIDLKNKFLPLKDFIVLKYDLFLQKNLKNVYRGGGVSGVAYQSLNYRININSNENILISLNVKFKRTNHPLIGVVFYLKTVCSDISLKCLLS